jgi:hypothetical protein
LFGLRNSLHLGGDDFGSGLFKLGHRTGVYGREVRVSRDDS